MASSRRETEGLGVVAAIVLVVAGGTALRYAPWVLAAALLAIVVALLTPRALAAKGSAVRTRRRRDRYAARRDRGRRPPGEVSRVGARRDGRRRHRDVGVFGQRLQRHVAQGLARISGRSASDRAQRAPPRVEPVARAPRTIPPLRAAALVAAHRERHCRAHRVPVRHPALGRSGPHPPPTAAGQARQLAAYRPKLPHLAPILSTTREGPADEGGNPRGLEGRCCARIHAQGWDEERKWLQPGRTEPSEGERRSVRPRV